MEGSGLDNKSLSHTKWNCKYHIVFAPKYRRQVICGQLKKGIGEILRKLCEYKEVEIIEANACRGHIHMYMMIPPKLSVPEFMEYLKGKSSLMIFDRHANLKYKYDNRHFWRRGYYVDTVGRNEKIIAEYARNQLQEDIMADQISLKEYTDPFTGEPVGKSKKK
jgi:putative transposase